MEHPPAVPAKNIVVAVDGSQPSRDAGKYAVVMAKALGARLQIVHVVDYSGLIGASAGAGTAWTAQLPAMQEDARTLVGLTVREAEKAKVAHTVHIIEGSEPALGVVAHAKAHGADLIVLGSHGRTGVARALLGSVAERVVRFATCPVLVYRARAAQDESEEGLSRAGPRGSDPVRRGAPGAAGR